VAGVRLSSRGQIHDDVRRRGRVGDDNSATPVDAFGLWPAATTLLLVAGVIGVVLITVRTVRWRRTGPVGRSVKPHLRG
jgi:hypothetical protein